VLSVVAAGSSAQIVFGIVVAVIFIKLYGYYAPYVEDDDDFIQELSQYQIFVTLLASLLIKTGASTLILRPYMDMMEMIRTQTCPYASTNTTYMYVQMCMCMSTDAFISPIMKALLSIVIIVAMLASSIAAIYFIWKEIRERSESVPPVKDEEENINAAKMDSPEGTHYPDLGADAYKYEEDPMKPSFDEANPTKIGQREPTAINAVMEAAESCHDEYPSNEKEVVQRDSSTGGTFFQFCKEAEEGTEERMEEGINV
jgi:hypothetical protein